MFRSWLVVVVLLGVPLGLLLHLLLDVGRHILGVAFPVTLPVTEDPAPIAGILQPVGGHPGRIARVLLPTAAALLVVVALPSLLGQQLLQRPSPEPAGPPPKLLAPP